MEKLTILLVGSGGREHALAWKIAQSPRCGRLVAAPGNPGIGKVAELKAVKATDADGLVALAEPGLHFEGGCTLIDHGQGLISVYLHQSSQPILKGQRVRRGQVIGTVGATGRATGPHLCWRLKWRNRNLDPSLLVGATAPAP